MSYTNWPLEAKQQILQRAKARLEQQRASEQRAIDSLSSDARRLYRLVVLRRMSAEASERIKQRRRRPLPTILSNGQS